MDFNVAGIYDSFKDGTKELAELTHEKTNEFHKNYVSKVLPDCGKYGDKARFIAEMVPGVTEYNAIRDGNWKDFAIAAGLDVASLGIGAVTAGAGYAAIKGSEAMAKEGTKLAVKEIAEAGTKKGVRKTAENIAEKVVKERTETGVESIATKTIEKTVKEIVEKDSKEIAENSLKKNVEETIIKKLDCVNEKLEGKEHPETGVKFIRKIVSDGEGGFVEGVFPKFESRFDAVIPKELYKKSNFKQFKEANKQLLSRIEKDISLQKKFTVEQIEQIKDGLLKGTAPDGYIWHHNEEAGILQLVNQVEHSVTRHTGGRFIWGGGY